MLFEFESKILIDKMEKKVMKSLKKENEKIAYFNVACCHIIIMISMKYGRSQQAWSTFSFNFIH